MKKITTKTVLMQYTCAIACYLLSGSTALYAVTSDESMTVTVTNQPGISAEKEREVRQSIARAPEVILSLDADVGVYVDETCKMIAGFPDPATRRRYYRAFIDRACTTCFEKIEENVPFEMPDVDPDFHRYNRNEEIGRLQSLARCRLEKVAEDIWMRLFFYDPVTSTLEDQFYSWFKFIEKMESEERRVRRKRHSLCDHAIDQIEYHFNFVYFKVMDAVKVTPDPQDIAVFKARFKQVVGRPIRSAEQYKADARRRTEETIKEHQKQQESNRRALEFQKKYNREHNINEQ